MGADAVRRQRRRRPLFAAAGGGVLLGLLAAGCSEAPHYKPPQKTYYVSPDGSDKANGRSTDNAWRTLQRANKQQLKPGDRLLLRGGERFNGDLDIRDKDAGRANNPVVIGSYGGGRATIKSPKTPAISVYNTAGVEIRGLKIVGGPTAFDRDGGIHAYNDEQGSKRHLTISDVEVSGFRNGIQIGSGAAGAGFSRVRISDAELHGNKYSGMLTYGAEFNPARPVYALSDLEVSGVEAHHNPGDPESDKRHSGNGIVLGSVKDGTVRNTKAHDNGLKSSKTVDEGPVGIWAYDSSDLDIGHSSSYRNNTGSDVDGAGFGLDRNVSNTVVHHNLSFENDGPGFHAYTGEKNGAHTDNTFRFNISSNDGQKIPENGGIDIHGFQIRDLDVYNNTVLISDERPERGSAIRLLRGMSGVKIRNNLIVTDGSPFVIADHRYITNGRFTTKDVQFQGNIYAQTGNAWAVYWSNRTYNSLEEWRKASGQERVDGKPSGREGDPCLDRRKTPDITSPTQAQRLVPRCEVVAHSGVDLRKRFGTDLGGTDYFGKPLKGAGLVGAAQPDQAD